MQSELPTPPLTAPGPLATRVPLQRRAPGGPPRPATPPARPAASDGTAADLTRVYLREIGRVPLLTAQDETDLARAVEAGLFAEERLDALGGAPDPTDPRLADDLARLAVHGRLARRRLIEANLRLVVSIAKRHTGRGLTLLDLVQEGNLGLMHAVEKFDHARGHKFSTYATWWIRQSISRALADQGRTIRVPAHVVEQINRLQRLRRTLHQERGVPPGTAELAARLGQTPARVGELLRLASEPVSLHTPVGPSGGLRLADVIEDQQTPSPSDTAAHLLLREHLAAALTALGPRESEVVRLRYGLRDGRPRTLEEIGRLLGVTRERVRQIEARTLQKLRGQAGADQLRGYLE